MAAAARHNRGGRSAEPPPAAAPPVAGKGKGKRKAPEPCGAGNGKRRAAPAGGRRGEVARRGASGDKQRGARSRAQDRKKRAEPDSKKRRRDVEEEQSITETARRLSDGDVAAALSSFVLKRPSAVLSLMRRWSKPILRAPIPGLAVRRPTQGMLRTAKLAVLRFYAREQALGPRSDIVKAFLLASGEPALRFDWAAAMGRVRRARFDNRQEIDLWTECFAMSSGDSNALSEIYVCGTKKVTLRALTSLICHEGMHNLARRVRPGNSFLAEDTEHIAMALIGDPQLVHDDGASRSGDTT